MAATFPAASEVWSCGSDTSKAILTDATLSLDLRTQGWQVVRGSLDSQGGSPGSKGKCAAKSGAKWLGNLRE